MSKRAKTLTEAEKKRIKDNARLTKANMLKAGFEELPKEKADSEPIKKIKNLILSRRPSKLDFRAILKDENIRRKIIKDDEFSLLKESIKEHGIFQNIVVEFQQIDHEKFKLKCVAGHRRLEALHDLEKEKMLFTQIDEKTNEVAFNPFEIPVQIISADANISDGKKTKQIALSENVHRRDLHFVEIADTYVQIMESEGLDADGLAKRFDKSKKSIDRLLKLARFFPEESKVKILEYPDAFPFQFMKDKIIDTANYKNKKFISSLVTRRLNSHLKDRTSMNDANNKKSKQKKKVEILDRKISKYFEEQDIVEDQIRQKVIGALIYLGFYPKQGKNQDNP